MTGELASLAREAMMLALLVAAPLLIAALVAGVITGVIGAVAQVQDPAVGTVARVAAVGVALAVFAPSIAHQIQGFAAKLWPLIAAAGHPA